MPTFQELNRVGGHHHSLFAVGFKPQEALHIHVRLQNPVGVGNLGPNPHGPEFLVHQVRDDGNPAGESPAGEQGRLDHDLGTIVQKTHLILIGVQLCPEGCEVRDGEEDLSGLDVLAQDRMPFDNYTADGSVDGEGWVHGGMVQSRDGNVHRTLQLPHSILSHAEGVQEDLCRPPLGQMLLVEGLPA